jgi:hypothetical protein
VQKLRVRAALPEFFLYTFMVQKTTFYAINNTPSSIDRWIFQEVCKELNLDATV